MQRLSAMAFIVVSALVVAVGAAQASPVKLQGDLALGWLCNYWSGQVGPVQGNAVVAVNSRPGDASVSGRVSVRVNGLAPGTYTAELTQCSGDVYPQPAETVGTLTVGRAGRGNLAGAVVFPSGTYELQLIVRFGAGGPSAYIALASEPFPVSLGES